MLTFMLSCWELNSSTSCRMYGPSPPVNPFQNARSTFGPLYSLPPPPPPCSAGLFCGPPPQPLSASPAPAPIPRSRNSCRVSLRTDGRLCTISLSSSLDPCKFYPPILVPPSLATKPTQVNYKQHSGCCFICMLRGRWCSSGAFLARDLPYSGRVCLWFTVVSEEAVDLLLDVGKLGVAETADCFAFQQGGDQGVVALEELFGVGDGAVSPSALFTGEGDAAELGDEYRLASVAMAGGIDRPLHRPGGYVGLGRRVAVREVFRIPVVVDGAEVCAGVFPAVVRDDGWDGRGREAGLSGPDRWRAPAHPSCRSSAPRRLCRGGCGSVARPPATRR